MKLFLLFAVVFIAAFEVDSGHLPLERDDQESYIETQILDDLSLPSNQKQQLSQVDEKEKDMIVRGSKKNGMLKNILNMIKSVGTNGGCPEGLFYFASSDQCFLLLNDTTRNWNQANAACTSKGLVLAQPYDPVGISHYIITRYGDSTWAWIGAKGTGSYVKFQRSNKYIGSSNPLWIYRTGSTSYCLALTTTSSYWKSYGDRVYYMRPCSSKYFTLCEMLPK